MPLSEIGPFLAGARKCKMQNAKCQIGIYRAANALPFGEGGPKGRERFSCKYAPSAHLFRQKSKIFATFPRGEGIAPAALKRTLN